MLKAVIFDLDDTLMITYPHAYERYSAISKELGIKPPTKKEFFGHYGKPWYQIADIFFPGIDYKTLDRIALKYGAEMYKSHKGAAAVLEALEKQGLMLCMLTGRTRSSLLLRTRQAGIPLQKFKYIYTADDLQHAKPDGRAFHPLLEELRTHNIAPEETIYIGDSMPDFLAAKEAGIPFIAVLTGWHKKHDFLAAGMQESRMLNKISELPEFLKKNNYI